MQIKVDSLNGLESGVKLFLSGISDRKTFAFYGEMGAGKTTFINAIMREMGIEDHSSSPTFSIVNEYLSPTYGSIFHFDFYRLDSEEEALDIGVEDIIYSNNYCFMEWPERIQNLLPEDTVKVTITVNDNCRLINVEI
ncbi:MAG: tRNA (adenosine(37)-N6)-threonylcarbamoyltransferase complex ATPase subunit type 1 TsaE [Putridiphycobacter sp.]|nr:tRNA (adenosine(37)-N6)-threonylcarbamoyltransferase complex ATPase subunit type 1 TsaE [Putridiphycobacter sp.]